jgi:hypothetical protein
MNRCVAVWLLMLLVGIVLTGCEPSKPVATAPTGPPAPPPPPGAPPAPLPAASSAPAQPPVAAPLPLETKAGVFAGSIDDLAARPAPPPLPPPVTPGELSLPPADPGTERVKAEKGVGIKGRSLDEYEGVIVTPVKAYFAAKERIVFEIQFPSQYQLYKAMDGNVPKDFDDLKAKVLDPYQIKLPPLPPGHKYVWDAGKEELMVERPKRQ